MKLFFLFFLFIAYFSSSLKAQTLLVDSINEVYLNKYLVIQKDFVDLKTRFPINSVFKKKNIKTSKDLLAIKSGFISNSYTSIYNSDSAELQFGIKQNILQINADLLVSDFIPIQASFINNTSNSPYFRDFTDFKFSFSANEFKNNILKNASLKHFDGMDFESNLNLNNVLKQKDEELSSVLNSYKEQADWKIIQYRFQTIINSFLTKNDTSKYSSFFSDSLSGNKIIDSLKKAKFLHEDYSFEQFKKDSATIEKVNLITKKFEDLKNSLDSVVLKTEQVKEKYEHFKNKNYEAIIKKFVTDKVSNKVNRIVKFYKFISGIKSFNIGRLVPNLSPLTVSGLNVKGVNLEYSKNNIYLYLLHGNVQSNFNRFRNVGLINGTFNNNVSINNNTDGKLTYAKVGFGNFDKAAVIFGYFSGYRREQTISNHIKGVSTEIRLKPNKYTNISGEVVKSIGTLNYDNNKKLLNFNNFDNFGYNLKLKSKIKATNTFIEGFYQYTGDYFRNFSIARLQNMKYNWMFKIEQPFFKHNELVVKYSMKMRDFNLNETIDQFHSKSVYTNSSVTFKKKNWSIVSVSYQPVSQFLFINNRVSEIVYQSLSSNIMYNFKINQAKSTVILNYNKFYNNIIDSIFSFGNTESLIFRQSVLFKNFEAYYSGQLFNNSNYTHHILNVGLQWNTIKQLSFGLDVKVNEFNNFQSKIGYGFNIQSATYKFGSFSIHFEDVYLPKITNGFNRYINGFATFQKSF